jgi:hypothetical protein
MEVCLNSLCVANCFIGYSSKLCVTSLDINGKFFIWNEHHIGLLQLLVQKVKLFLYKILIVIIVSQGVAISDSTIDNFIQTLQTNSSYLNGSLKFAQLFCSLLRKNSNEVKCLIN